MMNRCHIPRTFRVAAALAACALFAVGAQAQNSATAEFVVTAQARKSSQPVPQLQQRDIEVRLSNRPVEIASFTPAISDHAQVQLVFLFDESTPGYLSLQFPSLRKFMDALPSTTEVAVAYMANGRAVMAQTLTTDHALAGKSLRLTNSIPGISGSPYFCLSDLAKHWPSPPQANTRRVVLMVTNGQDPYYTQADMQDPYLSSAIADAQKAGLLVYSIYFHDVGFRSTGRLGVLFGQNYLEQVSSDTGGNAYNKTTISPVSFDPYLKEFKTALENQYFVSVPATGKGLQRLQVKTKVSGLKVVAPAMVQVGAVK